MGKYPIVITKIVEATSLHVVEVLSGVCGGGHRVSEREQEGREMGPYIMDMEDLSFLPHPYPSPFLVVEGQHFQR